jgi:DNA processing protein
VPGSLLSSVSMGTNLLIKHGAKIVTNTQDILSEYGRAEQDELFSKKESYGLNKTQVKILQYLEDEPLGIDDIARLAGKKISEIGAELTLLSLKKSLSLNEGKYYLIKVGKNAL